MRNTESDLDEKAQNIADIVVLHRMKETYTSIEKLGALEKG